VTQGTIFTLNAPGNTGGVPFINYGKASSRLHLRLLSLLHIPECQGKGMNQSNKLLKPEISKQLVLRWFLGLAFVLGLVAILTDLVEDI
jgi:hypothetical protein